MVSLEDYDPHSPFPPLVLRPPPRPAPPGSLTRAQRTREAWGQPRLTTGFGPGSTGRGGPQGPPTPEVGSPSFPAGLPRAPSRTGALCTHGDTTEKAVPLTPVFPAPRTVSLRPYTCLRPLLPRLSHLPPCSFAPLTSRCPYRAPLPCFTLLVSSLCPPPPCPVCLPSYPLPLSQPPASWASHPCLSVLMILLASSGSYLSFLSQLPPLSQALFRHSRPSTPLARTVQGGRGAPRRPINPEPGLPGGQGVSFTINRGAEADTEPGRGGTLPRSWARRAGSP